MTKSLKRAQLLFEPEAHRLPRAPEMPARPVCPELLTHWQSAPEAIRKCAWRIAVLKTREQRALVWRDVPLPWRDAVARAVGLILAGQYGCCAKVAEVRARIDTEVPQDLAAVVMEQSLFVWQLRRQAVV